MKDRVALVTGGGNGIGRATALAFAARGAKVVVCDLDEQGGEATQELILEQGGKALFYQADVSKSEEVDSLVAKTVEAFGRLDYAHNNAGIIASKLCKVDEYAEDEWHRMIAVNLTGVWLCMKHELAQMIKQGEGGAIVNTSSMAGLMPIAGSSPYVAAKHGVIGITKAAALEYAAADIRINAVCPGYIETPMLSQLISKNKEARGVAQLLNRIPLKRLGQPEDIAESVLWLCSDAASYLTGHALQVDAGMVAQGMGPA